MTLGTKLFTQLPLVVLLSAALFVSCAEDDNPLTRFEQALVVEIIAGPQEGSTLLNNEFFTFEWRTRGGSDASFEVQLSGVDATPVSTTESSRTYAGQPEGDFSFSVTARAGSENSTASRSFKVGPNLGPPEVNVTGARGSASAGGSGIVPAYAPGRAAFFNWSGKDIDRFGEVTGYRWRTTDAGAYNDFSMAEVAGFDVPSAPGTYTFTVEAKDNGDLVSQTSLSYEVKEPAIVIVDDKTQSDAVNELEEDLFYASLFEGFSFATWDVAESGVPAAADLGSFEIAVVYSGSGSAMWADIGTTFPETPVSLSAFADGGGKLWVMGQGIMEDIAGDHSNPPDASEFESTYLHLAAATGDSATDASLGWARAGDFSGDLKFSFADDVLGQVASFPRIAIDVQSGDVENITPDAGSEIIYAGKGGLGDVVGNVALRSPAGGANTELVFMTFPLFENQGVKASLANSRTLTQTIMGEMGQ